MGLNYKVIGKTKIGNVEYPLALFSNRDKNTPFIDGCLNVEHFVALARRGNIDYITALATDTEIEGLNIQAGLASKTTFRNILSGLASVANIPERKNKVLQAATVLFSPEKDFATDPFSNLSELLEESVIPSKNRKNMSNYFEARFLELRKKLFYES